MKIRENWGKARSRWQSFGHKADVLAIAFLLFTSAILRVPFLEHPPYSIADESIFQNYVINTTLGQPFFEPQPPLGWFLLSLPVSMDVDDLAATPIKFYTNTPFGRFPYADVRLVVAIFGMLIPVLIYAIGRLLSLSALESVLPAAIAVFDGALIVHSRIIMLESIWIAFGLAGFLTVVAMVKKVERKQGRFLTAALGGLLLGFSAAAKLLGLAFWGMSIVYLLLKKWYKAAIGITAVLILAYIFSFWVYLESFSAGKVRNLGFWRSGPGTEVVFPGPDDWLGNLKLVGSYTALSIGVRASSTEVATIVKRSHPHDWPLMQTEKEWPYWTSTFGKSTRRELITPIVSLQANQVSWGAALFAILTLIYAVVSGFIKGRGQNENEMLLLIAYAGNYVPHLFIDYFADSPSWFYHYLPALCISFLMIPFMLRRLGKFRELAYTTILFGTIVIFFYQVTNIYGW